MERTKLGRRELNKLLTRERLVVAARELFEESGTFTTVEEIAERAEVSRATFFNYFPSKDDLFAALYAVLFAQLTDVISQLLERDLSTPARIQAVFTDFAGHAVGDSRYLLTFTAELERAATTEQSLTRHEALVEQFRRILEAADVTEVRGDYPRDFLARMVAGVYVGAMRTGWGEQEVAAWTRGFELAGRFAGESVCVPLSRP